MEAEKRVVRRRMQDAIVMDSWLFSFCDERGSISSRKVKEMDIA